MAKIRNGPAKIRPAEHASSDDDVISSEVTDHDSVDNDEDKENDEPDEEENHVSADPPTPSVVSSDSETHEDSEDEPLKRIRCSITHGNPPTKEERATEPLRELKIANDNSIFDIFGLASRDSLLEARVTPSVDCYFPSDEFFDTADELYVKGILSQPNRGSAGLRERLGISVHVGDDTSPDEELHRRRHLPARDKGKRQMSHDAGQSNQIPAKRTRLLPTLAPDMTAEEAFVMGAEWIVGNIHKYPGYSSCDNTKAFVIALSSYARERFRIDEMVGSPATVSEAATRGRQSGSSRQAIEDEREHDDMSAIEGVGTGGVVDNLGNNSEDDLGFD